MWLSLSQVNGVLPILPLLFPVLWVLATACGEARVLAQMSRGSPSSLVGFSKALGEPAKRTKAGTKEGVGGAPVSRSGSPALLRAQAHGRALGSSPGREPLHPEEPSCQAPGRGGTCQLGGLCEDGSVLPEAHPLFSVQLAKFSEDTLSSYTEAISTQVHSPGVDSALGPFWNPGTP